MERIKTSLLFMLLIVSSFSLVLADPNGALSVTEQSSERGPEGTAANHSAYAGNVTEITISGDTLTQSWQGYFGNVTGGIQLQDASGNAMYNWSAASPSGEVFASIASSITWANIECFNWTANGTDLETTYNINDSVDGVNETFAAYGTNPHADFTVGSVAFNSTTACMSADIYDSTGTSVDGTFEEVLLSDTTNTIFAALLEQDVSGFDSASHDFEMLVLEDGHAGDTSTTPYFFYVEIE